METPALEHLLSAYFHLDWYDEHGDEWANVDDFIAGAPGLVGRLPREIAQVLDAYKLACDSARQLYNAHYDWEKVTNDSLSALTGG